MQQGLGDDHWVSRSHFQVLLHNQVSTATAFNKIT